MSNEIHLTQLRRMLSEPFSDLGAAGEAIAHDPVRFSQALLAEAATSDDVYSVESARVYIEARLADLGETVPTEAAKIIGKAIETALTEWE